MKQLWVLPLAALLCGRPVNPPALKPALPQFKKGSCQEAAHREFLLAYAYREESQSRSARHLGAARIILGKCEETQLRSRLNKFKSSAP